MYPEVLLPSAWDPSWDPPTTALLQTWPSPAASLTQPPSALPAGCQEDRHPTTATTLAQSELESSLPACAEPPHTLLLLPPPPIPQHWDGHFWPWP